MARKPKDFSINHSKILTKSFFLTVATVVIFSVGTYFLANDALDQAATGDNKVADYYIAGLVDSLNTQDNYWSEALKGCRSGLQQNDYEKNKFCDNRVAITLRV